MKETHFVQGKSLSRLKVLFSPVGLARVRLQERSVDQQRADVKHILHFYSEQDNQKLGDIKTHKSDLVIENEDAVG